VNRAIAEALGSKAASAVSWTFDAMGVAEREIERAGGRRGNAVWKAFALVRPTEGFHGKSLDLYADHVREIITRVKRGEDTRLGTAAEVLCLMSTTSLAAPLNRGGDLLCSWAFREVFGRPVPGGGEEPREEYAGQLVELAHEARRKLTQEWRRREELGSRA